MALRGKMWEGVDWVYLVVTSLSKETNFWVP